MSIEEAIKQLTEIREYRAYWLKYADLKHLIEPDIAALDLAIEALNDIGAACRMLYDAIEATYKPSDTSCGEWLKYNAGKALDLIKKYQDEEEVQCDD